VSVTKPIAYNMALLRIIIITLGVFYRAGLSRRSFIKFSILIKNVFFFFQNLPILRNLTKTQPLKTTLAAPGVNFMKKTFLFFVTDAPGKKAKVYHSQV